MSADDGEMEVMKGQDAGGIQFDPIDSRHISSLQVLRSRVVKLLKHSKNNMHAYNNFSASIVSGRFLQSSLPRRSLTFVLTGLRKRYKD